MLSKPQRLLCWSRTMLLLSPFSGAVNGGTAGRERVGFAPCKLSGVLLCMRSPGSHLWLRAGACGQSRMALHPPYLYPPASKDTCHGSWAHIHRHTCDRHTQSKHPCSARIPATQGFRDREHLSTSQRQQFIPEGIGSRTYRYT